MGRIIRDERRPATQMTVSGRKKLPHLLPMLASSAPPGVLGLLPVTLRSEKGEYTVKLGGVDSSISREMGVRVKRRKEMSINKSFWDEPVYISGRTFRLETVHVTTMD